PRTGRLRVLDSSTGRYAGLAWRKDADDLVVLRSRGDERHFGANWSVLAWSGAGTAAERAHRYEPAVDASVAGGLRIAPFRKPSWSEDGRIVFVGVSPWIEKPE